MIILGILLVRNPAEVSIAVCIFIGIAFCAAGLAMVITFLVNRSGRAEGFGASPVYGIFGAILAAFGIFIWVNPKAIINFVTILFAVVIIVHAIYEIAGATVMKEMGGARWYLGIIFSVIKLILAFMIIVEPFQIAQYIMIFAGISLILCGVTGIVQNIGLIRTSKAFRKAAGGTASGRDVIEGEILSEEDVDDNG